MLDIALTLLVIASALGFLIGLKYMRANAFMSYQSTVTGRAWSQIDIGMQTVILGMLKIIGAGYAALGLVILWLCLAIHERVQWAPWAILTIAAVLLGPTLYVAIKLRSFQPAAKTPITPTLAAIVLILVGVGLSVIALRSA